MERRYVLFFAIALAIVITSQMLQSFLFPKPPVPAVSEEAASKREPPELPAAG